MNTQRNGLPGSVWRSGPRLENAGFGSTLVAMAVAALVVVAAPLAPGAHVANWLESCASLVTHAWPLAAATLGASG
jgi:hypothetical protein